MKTPIYTYVVVRPLGSRLNISHRSAPWQEDLEGVTREAQKLILAYGPGSAILIYDNLSLSTLVDYETTKMLRENVDQRGEFLGIPPKNKPTHEDKTVHLPARFGYRAFIHWLLRGHSWHR